MAEVREQTSTTTNSTTTTINDEPRVEVYDNDKPTPSPVMYDEERVPGTTPYSPVTPVDTTPDGGMNWGLIVLVVLVVLALLALYTWYF